MGTIVHVQTKPSGPVRSVTGPGSNGPDRIIARTSWWRCDVTEMLTCTPVFGLRGTNHICSSPRQPLGSTGTLLTAVPGVGVGVAWEAAAVAVRTTDVAELADCVLCRATCVPVTAVAVNATAVAVWATLVGSVGSAWAAVDNVSARNACASDVSGRSAGRSSASGRDGAYWAKKRECRTAASISGDRSTPTMIRLSQSPSNSPWVLLI